MRTCSNCGRSEQTTGAFCAYCGAAYPGDAPVDARGSDGTPTAATQDTEPQSAKPSGKPSRGVLIGGAIAIALALFVVGGLYYKDHQDKVEKQEAAALAKKKKHDAAVAKFQRCKSDLGDLIDSETELNSRLTSGLNFSKYSDKVGDVNVAYGRVDIPSLDPACLDAGAELETAMNTFNRVATRWNNCIQDFDCDVDSLSLSKSWGSASVHIQNAQDALAELDPDSGS